MAGCIAYFASLHSETDLGIATWNADKLGDPVAIDARLLSGHFALATITHPVGQLWVTVSLCHVSNVQLLSTAT